MKKGSFRQKFSYKVDNLMSKGTGMLILALFSITMVVVLIVGATMLLVDPEFAANPGMYFWNTFMFALDAGTLAGYTSSLAGIAALAITTICGIFITSMLIGILNNGLESKMAELRKGTSRVVESGHAVILGFNQSIYTILSELIIANENKKHPVIVVLGDEDKEIMEEQLKSHLPDTKNTVIICRSGNSADMAALERCSIENCSSVIINEQDDFQVIKAILVVTTLLKNAPECEAFITATVQEQGNVAVAKIAGEGRAEILYFKSTISRIMAQTCRQPGMSAVFTELFDFGGDEIYIEEIAGTQGKTMRELVGLFADSSVIGLQHNGKTMLNPPMDTICQQGDALILIAADDHASLPMNQPAAIETHLLRPEPANASAPLEDDLLVLGYNDLLPEMLKELDHYIRQGTMVKIALTTAEDEESLAALGQTLQNAKLTVCLCDIFDRNLLKSFVDEGFEHIVLLSDLTCDSETADSKTLMLLLHLRDIAQKGSYNFSITSEMLNVRNQELAKVTRVNDFVISSNITSLITAQISQDRQLIHVFDDLLDEDGSEIYMKPAQNFVALGEPVSLFTVTYEAAQRGETFIGYKKFLPGGDGHAFEIVTNPPKSSRIVFSPSDLIIVISEQG